MKLPIRKDPRTGRPYVALPPVMGPPDPPVRRHVTPPNPMQWGSTRLISATEWQRGVPLAINSLDKSSSNWRIPYTQSLVLAAEIPVDVGGDFALRWQLQFGAGGGFATFLIDAGGAQQITIPAEQLRVSILADSLATDSSGTYSAPTKDIRATCFFADGTTATDPPTFTQRFNVSAGNTVNLSAPAGATAFRVAGNPQAVSNPYAADCRYDVFAASTAVIDRFFGDYILPIRYMDYPFSGQAAGLQITAGAANASGFIEWVIDL